MARWSPAALLPAATLRVSAQEDWRAFTGQVFEPSAAVLPGVASLSNRDA